MLRTSGLFSPGSALVSQLSRFVVEKLNLVALAMPSVTSLDQASRSLLEAITHEEALASLRVRHRLARARVDLQDATADLGA
jgi:hypothetical protein